MLKGTSINSTTACSDWMGHCLNSQQASKYHHGKVIWMVLKQKPPENALLAQVLSEAVNSQESPTPNVQQSFVTARIGVEAKPRPGQCDDNSAILEVNIKSVFIAPSLKSYCVSAPGEGEVSESSHDYSTLFPDQAQGYSAVFEIPCGAQHFSFLNSALIKEK